MNSELIIKHLLGTANESEEQELTAWRKQSQANEQLLQRLTDSRYLESEYRKRKAVNTERAAEQMRQRIGKGKTQWLRPSFYRTAAAVLAFALGCGTLTYHLSQRLTGTQQPQEQLTQQPLRPGQTLATLTMASGKTMQLTSATSVKKLPHTVTEKPEEQGDSQADKPTKLTLDVPRGGEFKIELEDGTMVWLNAQSRLVYPESFSETERRVQVEGEAYFKVAHDEGKPFYVEVDNQVVRVLGTEFNVHAFSEDLTVQTTLVSGQIAMQQKGSNDCEMILTPGHQAIFDKTAQSIRVKSVDTEVITSWKDGMFVFEDQDLASIMLTLSRWYDFDYQFTDKEAASTVFMGRIPRYSEFDDVMQIIEMSGGLKLTLKGRNLTISSSK